MTSREHLDAEYHGETDSDEKLAISELDNLGLQGLTIKDAQTVVASDVSHMLASRRSIDYAGPNPFDKEEAISYWLAMQEQAPRRQGTIRIPLSHL